MITLGFWRVGFGSTETLPGHVSSHPDTMMPMQNPGGSSRQPLPNPQSLQPPNLADTFLITACNTPWSARRGLDISGAMASAAMSRTEDRLALNCH
jgi:hypothetical protein